LLRRHVAIARGSTASDASKEAASAAPAALPMWLDLRMSVMAKALGSLGFAQAQQPDQKPDVKATLKELLEGLREKFGNIGMPQPKGKIVDAVLVEERWRASVAEDVEDLGLAVYTASRDIEGVKLPGGAFFVCDAATEMPVGALEAPPVQFSAAQRFTVQDVWSFVPKEEPSQEEAETEEEVMRRYKEGLEDDAEYVPPPWSRIRELMGVPSEEGCLPVKKGQVLARILPPNPLLWARALMQQRKDAGSRVPTYRIKSDSKAVPP